MRFLLLVLVLLFSSNSMAQNLEILTYDSVVIEKFAVGDIVYIESVFDNAPHRDQILAIDSAFIYLAKDTIAFSDLTHIGMKKRIFDFVHISFKINQLASAVSILVTYVFFNTILAFSDFKVKTVLILAAIITGVHLYAFTKLYGKRSVWVYVAKQYCYSADEFYFKLNQIQKP